jgi:serine/threonine-protein kinase RsbW/stage II sporulation protein AB (anti-sigma F factor)
MPSSSWTAPAAANSVPELRQAVVDVAYAHGVLDPCLSDIRLAVSEAVSNAVVHAFRGRADGTVTVSIITRDPVWVEVRVTDDGSGMAPRDDSPGIGLGLPLIRHLTDRFEHRRPPDGVGTEVWMRFRRAPQEHPMPADSAVVGPNDNPPNVPLASARKPALRAGSTDRERDDGADRSFRSPIRTVAPEAHPSGRKILPLASASQRTPRARPTSPPSPPTPFRSSASATPRRREASRRINGYANPSRRRAGLIGPNQATPRVFGVTASDETMLPSTPVRPATDP